MIVTQVWCCEPEGMALRTVHREERTVEHLLDLYTSMQQGPNFLASKNPLGVLLAPDTEILEVDNVGALVAVAIQPGHEAHAHMTFWDARLRGREGLVRTTAELVMQAYQLNRIWTAIPLSSPKVIAFTERVGFKRFYQDDDRVGLRLERSHGN